MLRILFVCTGNICRSPAAEAALRKLVHEAGLARRVEVASAGTTDYHTGEPPDPRARRAALGRGLRLDGITARQVRAEDFVRYDLILAMDEGHLKWLDRRCPHDRKETLGLFMDFVPGMEGRNIPDPYYGDAKGFERMLDAVETAAAALLDHLRETHLKSAAAKR